MSEWTKQTPTEQGMYWYWNCNPDDAPILYQVLYSGTSNSCFISAGQYGMTQAVFL